jgi:anti-sigma factor RsiW
MNCREIEIHAIEYHDGKLAIHERRDERRAVELHLAGCAACAERLRGFSDVSAMLGTWESIEPSASFNSRLERRLASQPAAAAGWWERLSMRLAWFPLGKPALAGAVLGMMLFGVILARYYPASSGNLAPATDDTPIVTNMMDGNDELVPVLENLDLLSNFEPLQELKTTTP